jgi:hypothetical protein
MSVLCVRCLAPVATAYLTDDGKTRGDRLPHR